MHLGELPLPNLWLGQAVAGSGRADARAELGGQVRKGERSTLVVKFGVLDKPGEENAGVAEAKDGQDGKDGRRAYLKAYNVFNAGQIDGAL